MKFLKHQELQKDDIVNLLNLQKDEKIAAVLIIDRFDSDDSIVFCTRNGVVKKSLIKDYKNHRKGGLIGINIDEGDRVLKAMIAKPNDHLLILSKNGKGLRFSCDQLRNQGRATRGVRGIRLKPKDLVVNMLVVDDSRLLLICGQNGLGIRTRFSAFLPNGGSDGVEDTSPRKRGGQGVTAMNTQAVRDALSVAEDSEILMLTKKGQAVRCRVSNIRETNRGSKGVKLINLVDRDSLVGVSEVVKLDEGTQDTDDINNSADDVLAEEQA